MVLASGPTALSGERQRCTHSNNNDRQNSEPTQACQGRRTQTANSTYGFKIGKRHKLPPFLAIHRFPQRLTEGI
jgi:hypothetical protein